MRGFYQILTWKFSESKLSNSNNNLHTELVQMKFNVDKEFRSRLSRGHFPVQWTPAHGSTGKWQHSVNGVNVCCCSSRVYWTRKLFYKYSRSNSCGLFSVATDGVTDTPSVATLSTLNNPQYCVIKKFKKINWPARTRANWFLDTVKPEHVELSDQSAAN